MSKGFIRRFISRVSDMPAYLNLADKRQNMRDAYWDATPVILDAGRMHDISNPMNSWWVSRFFVAFQSRARGRTRGGQVANHGRRDCGQTGKLTRRQVIAIYQHSKHHSSISLLFPQPRESCLQRTQVSSRPCPRRLWSSSRGTSRIPSSFWTEKTRKTTRKVQLDYP